WRYLRLPRGGVRSRVEALAGKIADRRPGLLDALSPALQQQARALLQELRERLETSGRELVPTGGAAAFADLLAGVAGLLGDLRRFQPELPTDVPAGVFGELERRVEALFGHSGDASLPSLAGGLEGAGPAPLWHEWSGEQIEAALVALAERLALARRKEVEGL